METFSRSDLDALMANSYGPSVSIFMPTHRAGVETLQDPVRLKNKLREARHILLSRNLYSAEIRQLLRPVTALVSDYDFWQHQRDGLALFRSAGIFRSFRVPASFEDSLVVADRFYVKPLLPLLTEDAHFYVLALSQNAVRVLDCNRDRAVEIELPHGIPKNFAAFLQYREAGKELQLHSIARRGKSRGFAIFHAQGGNDEEKGDQLLQYFRAIDRGLQSMLRNERAPLVLAAVEYCFPLYKAVNTHSNLAEEGIFGNTDTWSPETLHAHAWDIVRRRFRQNKEAAVAKYAESLPLNRASNDVKEIVRAACDGRIAHLIVSVGVQQWGRVDPSTRTVEFCLQATPGSEDLLDLAAIHTLTRGGSVYAAEPSMIPNEAAMAAVFRY